MRILYIVTQGEWGGAQKNVLDLSVGMKERGHEVFIAVGEIENEGDKWLQADFELKNLQREVIIKKDVKAVWEIIDLLKKTKPDVVHLHSSKVGVVGGLACFIYNIFFGRTRSIYTVHGFVFLEPMSFIKKYFFVFLELVSSFARSFTILISPVDYNLGKKLLILRGQEGSYKIIYNGLDESLKSKILSREEARKYLLEKTPPVPFGKSSSKIVGTISNLYKTKGLEYFIDAAAQIKKVSPNTIFLVLGFGDEKYREELEVKVRKNNLANNFFFLGKTVDAYKYLRGLDVFTLTSVKEGLPYTLIEASMAGVPIVASAVGGIPEMAKHISIDLVEAKNVEQIKNKILENLNKPHTETNLPKIYSLKNMLDETEKVYEK